MSDLESVNLAGYPSWADQLSRAAGDLDRDAAPPAWVETAASVAATAPTALRHATERLIGGAVADNALLVRGLDGWLGNLQPTPLSVQVLDRDQAARISALALLAVLTLVGEPFTFASLYGGKLVQDVLPVQGHEQAQTSEGSESFLEWHVEDAFTQDRCHYFGLFCLRGDPSAATLFMPARQLRLDPAHVQVLGQDRFVMWPDSAHGSKAAGRLVSVLAGDPGNPEICYDPVYMAPQDSHDQAATAALAALARAVETDYRSYVLQPGDLIVLDNRRVVHGRTGFNPRYDGADRWLMRVMVSEPAYFRQRGGHRIIDNLTAR